jgi:hypothetical protein
MQQQDSLSLFHQMLSIVNRPFGFKFALFQALLVLAMAIGFALQITGSTVEAAPKKTHRTTVQNTTTAKRSAFALPQSAMPYVKIYFSTYEFPNRGFASVPSDAEKKTLFYKYLGWSLQNHGRMALVNNFEKSDYRVELECAGIIHCSQLQLNIYDSFRNYLATVKMPRPKQGTSEESLQLHAEVIATELQKRLMAFNSGGFGTYDSTKPNRFD